MADRKCNTAHCAQLQEDLERLALACIEIVVSDGGSLTPRRRTKFLKVAKGAINRAISLPELAKQDAAWLLRTSKFVDAVGRFVLAQLTYEHKSEPTGSGNPQHS